MDSNGPLDPLALGLLALAYLGIGLVWLTLALRTNRQR